MKRFSAGSAIAAALALSCSSPSSRDDGGTIGITPEKHTWFPITLGTKHELGRAITGGVETCESCHASTNTSFEQFDCIGCHEHAQDLTDPIHRNIGDYRYASEGCYQCHPDGTGAGMAPAQAHDPQADVAVTSLVPSWSSTSIVSVSSMSEALSMHMNHVSQQFAAAANSACANCHPNVDTGSYYPGQLHLSLLALMLPQPTACSDCHGLSATPTGFVGPTAMSPARTPGTGEMRHDAVAWNGGVPTALALVTDDCTVCHVPPSAASAATWSTNASYHAALTTAGKAQPGQCLDCHANTRPAAVLTSANAVLPMNLSFDHGQAAALGECIGCHTKAAPAQWQSWTGGRFHVAGSPAPSTCLPCHAQERPTTTTGWVSPPDMNAPFDYVPNANGITHGAGLDCASCHTRTQDWTGGNFVHDGSTLTANTCVACHTTQRPGAVVMGFDHATSGTGDCFGCHQTTVTNRIYATLANWAGGAQYPGSTLISSSSRFITVTQLGLNRSGPNNLVTSTTTTTGTLYNAMKHFSVALRPELNAGPSPGDPSKCWHCHTSAPGTTTVTSYRDGVYHAALTNYRDTPDAGTQNLGQPTTLCAECHSNMWPTGIVENGGSSLQPMDHAAQFKTPVSVGGAMVSRVSQLDCSVCHSSPGGAWTGGVFHARIGAAAQAQLQDCTVCHYPLMADAARADVTTGTRFKMLHRSGQLTFQKCDTCHTGALANSTLSPTAARWATGAYHGRVTAQPTACVDCHSPLTLPAATTQSTWSYNLVQGATATNKGQYMSHASSLVTGRDCAYCHQASATATTTAWSKSDKLHITGITPTTCRNCHGLSNGGGAVPGTSNNMPAGLNDSATVTTASAATGVPANTRDQISHSDVNVTGKECNFCHTQVGIAASGAGNEWAQATFHAHYTGANVLVMNGSTGRCSNCHLNVKPGASYTAQDHSQFTATSAQDCSSCHGWPGTGSATSPNWLGAAGVPQLITVGGFTIAQPPAPNATTTQAGLNNLRHPATSGLQCTSCHALASGGKQAHGYDHALAPTIGCRACHESGSNLVGTPWTLNASGAVSIAAQCSKGSGTILDRGGDTRPVGLATLACSDNARNLTCGSNKCTNNHFYPADCGECHRKPTTVPATVQTGTTYKTDWHFQHSTGTPIQPTTCCMCHSPPGCRG